MKLIGWAIALAAVLATPAAAQSADTASPAAAAASNTAATNAMAQDQAGTGGAAQAATQPFH